MSGVSASVDITNQPFPKYITPHITQWNGVLKLFAKSWKYKSGWVESFLCQQ